LHVFVKSSDSLNIDQVYSIPFDSIGHIELLSLAKKKIARKKAFGWTIAIISVGGLFFIGTQFKGGLGINIKMKG
jgi:hypothetical protein